MFQTQGAHKRDCDGFTAMADKYFYNLVQTSVWYFVRIFLVNNIFMQSSF